VDGDLADLDGHLVTEGFQVAGQTGELLVNASFNVQPQHSADLVREETGRRTAINFGAGMDEIAGRQE
jgi:hypothetical protein